jgi:hypothetical protein
MRFDVQMIFQSYGCPKECSDADVIADEVRLGELADQLVFDCLWPVETAAFATRHACLKFPCRGSSPPLRVAGSRLSAAHGSLARDRER